MSVNYTGVSQNVTAMSVIYTSDATVKALAQAAMVSLAEADIDMIVDCSKEYPTKADIENVFQGLHDQATDLINDVFDDIKARVLRELAEKSYTARVSGLHYDDTGALSDITVSVAFE